MLIDRGLVLFFEIIFTSRSDAGRHEYMYLSIACKMALKKQSVKEVPEIMNHHFA